MSKCGYLSRKLKIQLSPLIMATEQIQKQNLDFEVESSEISEYNAVLNSISEMKDSLKLSLEQQWKAEQSQREQIAALAHDLKTPLTVIFREQANVSASSHFYIANPHNISVRNILFPSV